MTALFQKYLYDGTTSVIVTFGHLYHNPKADVITFMQKPDPDDPDVRSINKLSDFQVDVYDDTALVSYKQVSTDSGHKLPALNGDYSLTCLDTFVRRKEWYIVGSACAPSAAISQAKWNAAKQKEEMAKQKVPPSSPQ